MQEVKVEHPLTDAQITDKKQQEFAALLFRVAELEQRVAALEAK